MTDEQRTHIERRLLEERARAMELLDRYRARTSDAMADRTGDLSHYPFHLADEGSETMEEELDASGATRVTRELEEIDEALQRLYREPKQFGRDERTGTEIPFERLDIIPWARTAADAPR